MPDTRTKIVRAALALCLEKGLAGASMSGVAAACGLQKSSLYSHFSSKAEIEAAVLALCRKTLVEGVGRLQVEKGDIGAALLSSALLLAEVLAEGESGLCHALVQSEKARSPQAAETARQIFNMARARIEVLFDLKLNPLDSSLPAYLFCAALERLIDDGADNEEIGRFCQSFLALTFDRETGSPQG